MQIGKSGLELVKVHPEVMPKNTLNEIVLKSMPLSSKEGDFTSSTVANCIFEGYIFGVPGKDRRNVASLLAVYNDVNYDREKVRKFFSFTIIELEKYNLADIETLSIILPNLFKGLSERRVKIKISSEVTLAFDFDNEEDKDKEENRGKKFLTDVWE